ncbi:TauD/TfdA family dioxygenase [Frankia sp. CNm7]|uniref:TauD/TfdA family dioxygenase n=1 Tax=Frankia nepalensis TaxID=1836974 RepID=A0A937R7M9_9ACTN|nr:TauD/TfdA family dioxygenase [Frankia nepalensis]MBL7502768.1 TauD/TfdA family dioxygenase [Frankia nepalensis]MBL7510665.1 TauD/TfdA family dioxygenase [Frankia nepalensis]MBL7522350.1 TauD/TfdA family dioxygenase [Frankia nepalensis]MBL7627198.1 TauD/TfdA family dioxygenase [Frankia nepalensis]
MAITTTPITPTTGVEITGLAGSALVDKAVAADTVAALDERGVVIYREADVADEDLVAFSRMLGEVVPPRHGSVKGHPEVQAITRDASKSKMAAYREATFWWHFDGSTDVFPDKYTLLTARAVSVDDDGDTEFANTYAAYDALSDEEKAELAGQRVVHSFAASQLKVYPDPAPQERAAWDRIPSREHPLVWSRRSGRTSMLLGSTAGEVVGRPADEGLALLDRLLAASTQPEFVVRHKWRRGDLVIWDNTGMLHRALPYGESSHRLMHRTSIAGDEAIA